MVDMKLALYTKTWTWMNWMAIIVFSIVIYIMFVLLGDIMTFFNSYKTASITFGSCQFYLLVLFFTVIVYIFDMTLLVVTKEVFTPLSIFFSSIMRRRSHKRDPEIFDKIVFDYKRREKLRKANQDAIRETHRMLNQKD